MEPSVIAWRKSSYSSANNPSCVELAPLSGSIGVRDSKSPGLGHLTLAPAAFTHLLHRAKSGNLNRPR